jgi:RNA polymerase sigma-70 factor (ECF subfamily)
MSEGALAGLAYLEDVADDPKLVDHYLVAAARGDLLARAGLDAEAVIAIERAADLAPTDQERRQLIQRAEDLRQP